MTPRVLLPLVALSLGACSKMTVEGTVVDPTGAPLPGATISLVGSLCQGQTDEAGAFSVSCPPGRYSAVVSMAGWHSADKTIDANERQSYPIGELELIPLPPGNGLWHLLGHEYDRPATGWVARIAEERAKAYCRVADESPITEIESTFTLVDSHAESWKLLRLDEDGCAQRLVWRSGTWHIDWEEAPEAGERRLGNDVLHRFHLPPGDYFLANWTSGRFYEDRAQSAEAGEKRYSGAHLRVR